MSDLLRLGMRRRGGYNWYVDSVTGNDSNDGKSASTAFATIAKLLTVLTAGQSVGLARGSTWKEQLNSTDNGIKVYAYGTGDNPLLDCSEVLANANFTKTGGLTNVYEASLSLAPQYAEQIFNIWENGSPLVGVANAATCDSTPGSRYVTANYGDITLYIHATDSQDPITNGKTYEYSKRNWGLCLTGSGCIANGITAKRNLSASGSLVFGRSASVYNCIAEDGNKHSVYVNDGAYLYNVWAYKAYCYNSTTSFFVYNENIPAGLGVTFDTCKAENDVYRASHSGWYGHNNISGTFGIVKYTNCTAINTDVGFDGIHANIEIDNCTISGTFNIVCYVKTSVTVSNCTWSTVANLIAFYGNNNTITLRNCTLAAGGAKSVVVMSGGVSGCTIDIQYCSINAGNYSLYIIANGNTLISKYNTFPGAIAYYSLPTTYTVDSDYNRFVLGTGNKFNANATNYTLDTWRSTFMQDINSTVG